MQIEFDDKEFRKYIEHLEKNVTRAVENGILATAIEGEKAAKLAEKAVITNRLRSSIHFETNKINSFAYKNNLGLSFNGSFTYRAKELEALFGTNVEYAVNVNDNPKSKGFGFFQAGVQAANRSMPILVNRELNKLYGKS